MNYLESYRFLFRSPKWGMNLLLCAVAPFVPIAGAMVLLGYQFDIIEYLHRHGDGDYPDFDFDRLMHYLKRGAWPFLVQLIVVLPVALLFTACYFIFLFGIMTSVQGGNSAHLPLWLAFGGCAFVFCFLLNIVVAIVLLPMTLRSGLMSDFAAGFSWPFIKDFLRRVWLPALLTELFLALTGTLLVLAGMLLFCVGMYPAVALVQFAHAYLLYELYEEYLRRGGQDIGQPVEVESYPDRDDHDWDARPEPTR